MNTLSASMQAYTGTMPVFPEEDDSQNTFYVLNLVSVNMEKVSSMAIPKKKGRSNEPVISKAKSK